jgi:hypothetical protein
MKQFNEPILPFEVRSIDGNGYTVDVYAFSLRQAAQNLFDSRPDARDGAVAWLLEQRFPSPEGKTGNPTFLVLDVAKLGRPCTSKD